MIHHRKLFILFLILIPCAGTLSAESEISEVSLQAEIYGFDQNDRMVKQYKVLKSYNIHLGRNPEVAKLHVTVKGTGDTQLVVDLVPVVGLTGWAQREGITDTKLLTESKTKMVSIQRLQKSLKLNIESSEVVFPINLAAIIEQFTQKQLWPVELHFNAGLFPTADETSLANNSKQFILTLDPPD
ncbi:MAG: hypothetical protein OEY38_22605 [Gammaproteobacteria bacterium]|nr:hypothetical protein [Gammaproteobacteria bacterium]